MKGLSYWQQFSSLCNYGCHNSETESLNHKNELFAKADELCGYRFYMLILNHGQGLLQLLLIYMSDLLYMYMYILKILIIYVIRTNKMILKSKY